MDASVRRGASTRPAAIWLRPGVVHADEAAPRAAPWRSRPGLSERRQALAGEPVHQDRHEHADASRRRAGRSTRRCSGRSSPARRSPRTRSAEASAARSTCSSRDGIEDIERSQTLAQACIASSAIDATSMRGDDRRRHLMRCQYAISCSDRWNSVDSHRRLVPPLLQEPARPAAKPTNSRKALKTIADPARLRLLSLIQAQPEGEACVCHLTEPLGLSQPHRQPPPESAP